MFLWPDCKWIDLGPHMAFVMVQYPIKSEKCFISTQDMCSETIIYVLLLQQPFTEGPAFLTVIWFQTCMIVYLSVRKSLYIVLLVEVISRTSARVLTWASLLPDAVLHLHVLPLGHSVVFQYREDWLLARRFNYFALCCSNYGGR
ncbi:hypothetical protein TNCT_263611 [Trichonephila clavata]|uniref:Uncharacterized protein n=1 Tax=Trichonephila clavata TaxID=2740835 RepID=A0A8X6K2I4_TRICU|nr:hypothetical protein TNCT_263611 [Trichonephila clavata]